MLSQSAEMMKEKGKLTSEEEEGEREREKHTPLESQQSVTKILTIYCIELQSYYVHDITYYIYTL
jgi:hypothetical protein